MKPSHPINYIATNLLHLRVEFYAQSVFLVIHAASCKERDEVHMIVRKWMDAGCFQQLVLGSWKFFRERHLFSPDLCVFCTSKSFLFTTSKDAVVRLEKWRKRLEWDEKLMIESLRKTGWLLCSVHSYSLKRFLKLPCLTGDLMWQVLKWKTRVVRNWDAMNAISAHIHITHITQIHIHTYTNHANFFYTHLRVNKRLAARDPNLRHVRLVGLHLLKKKDERNMVHVLASIQN